MKNESEKIAKRRATKIEYNRRLLAIQSWIIEGIPANLMVQSILSQDWCESSRHAERMLASAREQWLQFEGADLHEKRRLKILQLQQLRRSLKEEYKGTPEGIRALLAIDKEIIKLEGSALIIKKEIEDEKPPAPPSLQINFNTLKIIQQKIIGNAPISQQKLVENLNLSTQ